MGTENKIEKYMAEKDLPKFFRDLADALEHGGKDEFVCVEDFVKFKLSVKNEFGQMTVKAKFKPAKPCEPLSVSEERGASGDPGKPRYKSLKKRMKSSFKMIVKMIHDGNLPPKAAVDSFLSDSKLMVTYPGFGDEFYGEYIEACNAFRKAYEAESIALCLEAVNVLSSQKGQCHAKYD